MRFKPVREDLEDSFGDSYFVCRVGKAREESLV